jgi:hypothetical protein
MLRIGGMAWRVERWERRRARLEGVGTRSGGSARQWHPHPPPQQPPPPFAIGSDGAEPSPRLDRELTEIFRSRSSLSHHGHAGTSEARTS